MPVPRFPLSLVVLALALALSACAPGDTSESAEDRARQEQDSPRPGPAEDALPYMEALADVYSREGMEEGLELAHPDHPAHGYFQHQIGIVQADIRSGFFSRVASMELVGDNIQVCRDHDGGCAAFRDFVFVDGLVADFQVNGNPLGKNFFPGSAEKSRNGVSVSVISSHYSFALDVLSVLLDVETDSGTEVTATDSWYVGQDGTNYLVDPDSGVAGQDHFSPATSGQVLLQYPQAPPRGEVGLVLECVQGCQGGNTFMLPLD